MTGDDSDESSSVERSKASQLADEESPVGWYEVVDPQGIILRSTVSLRSTWITRYCDLKF